MMISGPREKLNWSIRYKIALGTAEGLRYLHEECQRRIIHKDIKASNILLSEDFEPQVPLNCILVSYFLLSESIDNFQTCTKPEKSDYGTLQFSAIMNFFCSTSDYILNCFTFSLQF